jgi:hypothetical protein
MFEMNGGPGMAEQPRSESRVVQIVLLLIGGLALSVGSCAGFLNANFGSDLIGIAFALGFFAGIIMMVGAFVRGVTRASHKE